MFFQYIANISLYTSVILYVNENMFDNITISFSLFTFIFFIYYVTTFGFSCLQIHVIFNNKREFYLVNILLSIWIFHYVVYVWEFKVEWRETFFFQKKWICVLIAIKVCITFSEQIQRTRYIKILLTRHFISIIIYIIKSPKF